MSHRARLRLAVLLAATTLFVSGCTIGTSRSVSAGIGASAASSPAQRPNSDSSAARPSPQLPALGAANGTGPVNLYAAAGPGMLSDPVRGVPPRVYVPNSNGDTVTVIDPKTFRILFSFRTGKSPQHVVPAYDLSSLWVGNDGANTLTELNPLIGRPVRTVPAPGPYNLYWTPGGAFAVVMDEATQQMVFLDGETMRQRFTVQTTCKGLNHLDYTADRRYAIASCEFAGKLIRIDMQTRRQVGTLTLGAGNTMPQDVRMAPDGSVFFVADMVANGVWIVDAQSFRRVGFLPTGPGAHGLYFDRSGQRLFVINRGTSRIYGPPHGKGSVSVIDWQRRRVTAVWLIPGGGSPDMGNLSVDGRQLWLSGRFDNEIYALDTTTGRLLARVPVGPAPHGLTYWPQPGRYSLGHTGITR